MKLEEFYENNSSVVANILGTINTNVMSNKWNSEATLLLNMSKKLWFYNLDRELNPIIEKFCTINSYNIESLTSANVTAIVNFLFNIYKDKWTKLYDYVYNQTYNPIWNVDGEETLETWTDYGKKTTNTKDWSDTSTVTDDINESDVYGFDSASPVGDSKSTRNGETEVVHDGTDTYEDSGRDHYKEVKNRGGNIGTVSTQNMLLQEIELRRKFNYFELVIKDIISELAINIY